MAIDFSGFIIPFQQLTIGEGAYFNLIPIVTVFLIAIAITRNVKHVMLLQLPLALIFGKLGIGVGSMAVVIYGALFAFNTFTLTSIGQLITSTSERFTDFVRSDGLRSSTYKKAKRLTKAVQQKKESWSVDDALASDRATRAYQEGLQKSHTSNLLDIATQPTRIQRAIRAYRAGIDVEKGVRDFIPQAAIERIQSNKHAAEAVAKWLEGHPDHGPYTHGRDIGKIRRLARWK